VQAKPVESRAPLNVRRIAVLEVIQKHILVWMVQLVANKMMSGERGMDANLVGPTRFRHRAQQGVSRPAIKGHKTRLGIKATLDHPFLDPDGGLLEIPDRAILRPDVPRDDTVDDCRVFLVDATRGPVRGQPHPGLRGRGAENNPARLTIKAMQGRPFPAKSLPHQVGEGVFPVWAVFMHGQVAGLEDGHDLTVSPDLADPAVHFRFNGGRMKKIKAVAPFQPVGGKGTLTIYPQTSGENAVLPTRPGQERITARQETVQAMAQALVFDGRAKAAKMFR